MKVIWSRSTVRDLIAIQNHIARDNPAAAFATVRRIRQTVLDRLPRQPSLGRPGRVPGTRELVVGGTPYLVPYRVVGDRIDIIRVFHGARQWPERF